MRIEIEPPANEAETFTLRRRFKVPRAKLWQIWTEARHLTHWWGPAGVTMDIVKLCFEPGGEMRYSMKPPAGPMQWGKLAYRHIEAPERLVIVGSFTDADGVTIRHPLHPFWPLEVLADHRFKALSDQCEVLTRFYPINASAQDRQMFQLGRTGLQMGFEGSYAALDRYLTEVASKSTES